METYKLINVFINYLKNPGNLRNLWIKCLFGCGLAALDGSAADFDLLKLFSLRPSPLGGEK